MVGKCAKAHVVCVVHTASGILVHGTNACANAQVTCPRESGEGYEKCSSVCSQWGHAEAIASSVMKSLGLYGGTAYLSGHYYACDNCQKALAEVGVYDIVLCTPK